MRKKKKSQNALLVAIAYTTYIILKVASTFEGGRTGNDCMGLTCFLIETKTDGMMSFMREILLFDRNPVNTMKNMPSLTFTKLRQLHLLQVTWVFFVKIF